MNAHNPATDDRFSEGRALAIPILMTDPYLTFEDVVALVVGRH